VGANTGYVRPVKVETIGLFSGWWVVLICFEKKVLLAGD
jgi:hypothetical protein